MGRLKMLLRLVLTMLGTVCVVAVGSAQAKSVYAITDHYAGTLRVYKIQGDQLEYQEDAKSTF